MKIAVYSEVDIVEEFLKARESNNIAFSCKDIDRGRELAKEYGVEFFTCFVRMANTLSSGDFLILAEDYKEFEQHVFKRDINIVIKDYPVIPAPIKWFDNSYLFEMENFFEKTKGTSINISPYFNNIPISVDTNIDIWLPQEKSEAALSVIGRDLLRLISDNYHEYEVEDIVRHIKLHSGEAKLRVDGEAVGDHFMKRAFVNCCLSEAKKSTTSFEKGVVIENIKKTGEILKKLLDFS